MKSVNERPGSRPLLRRHPRSTRLQHEDEGYPRNEQALSGYRRSHIQWRSYANLRNRRKHFHQANITQLQSPPSHRQLDNYCTP